jgi:membrane-associated phospholipid phosphatase
MPSPEYSISVCTQVRRREAPAPGIRARPVLARYIPRFMSCIARSTTSWVLGLALLLAPAFGAADASKKLRYDPWLDGTVTAAGAALVVANGLFEAEIAPSSCSWCDRGRGGDDTLNDFDAEARGLRLSDSRLVRKWGDIAIWRLLPQLSLGLLLLASQTEDRPDDGAIDALIVLEATVLDAIGTQVVRYLTARERPYVHVLSPEERSARELSPDVNSSFFSGHASVSFAMAVAAGTVATLRGSRWAPFIWVVGLSLASLAAYSRVAADLHYATDVVVGVAFGSLVGFGVPYLLHRPAQ